MHSRPPIVVLALALGLGLAATSPAHAAIATEVDAPAPGPWALAHDASPAFSPDGDAVVFARGHGITRRLLVATRQGGRWSMPAPAPFSGGNWMDLEPAMAPDGSFLLFVSNRPAAVRGKALDGHYEGQFQPGRGGNLWRVA
ncbi:MAG TPA: hypothetical protein VFH59_12985, partial [Frateuria sp.]|uniref:TolB family protein n=1 Tax=Frateuria sp. TaxID=2211372 RepID=UPI002DA88FF1|nr:hypothetical protein [Frateuria sp.]